MSAINESLEQEAALHQSRQRFSHSWHLKRFSELSSKGKVPSLLHSAHFHVPSSHHMNLFQQLYSIHHVSADKPEDAHPIAPNLWQDETSPQRQDRNGRFCWTLLEIDHIRLLCQIASNRPDIVAAVAFSLEL